jgi:glycosyltransferase involved in cell wall biosynthesis
MRILLTIHQFFPKFNAGTEVAARDTALELARRGHDVHVLTVDPDVRESRTTISREDYEFRGLSCHALQIPRASDLIGRLEQEYRNDDLAMYVGDFTKELGPEVIHMFHLARLSGALIDVFRPLGVPLVFTSTDFWSFCARNILAKPSGELCEGPNATSSNCLECRQAERWFTEAPSKGDRTAFYERVAQQALDDPTGDERLGRVRTVLERTEYLRAQINKVDAVLAPTDIMGRMLVNNGIREDLVKISPYALDNSGFAAVRERREPEEGRVRFGFIGTLARPKGVHILAEAFGRIPEEVGASLLIVGNLTSKPDYSEELLAALGPDERVNFTGLIPNEEVPEQLESLDVLVVPSTWYENSPITIYQALTAGVPVVASDLGGISEVVRDGENGLLFVAGDAVDLEHKMKRLIYEPGLIDELRRNASEARTASDGVDELLAIYRQIRIDRRSSAAPRGRAPAAAAPASDAHTMMTAGNGSAPGSATAEPPFFVVGRAKSGTTWLMRMLNLHPEVMCRGEGRFFGLDHVVGDSGIRSLYGALAHSRELALWMGRSAWTRDEDPGEIAQELTGVIAEYLLERGRAPSGKRLVGDKTPLTGRDVITEIARIVPAAKVLHLMRDGRDVAVSSVHHLWNQAKQEGGLHQLSDDQMEKREAYRRDPTQFGPGKRTIFSEGELVSTAEDWAEQTRRARADGEERFGPAYLELRYEDMLLDVTKEFRRVLEFLGAEADADVMARCVERTSFERLSRGRVAGEERSDAFFRKGIAGDWVNVFTDEDRDAFKQTSAGGLLVELGYEQGSGW